MSSSMAERDRLDELRGRGVLSLKQYLITEISRNISRRKVVVAEKDFLERRRCPRRNSWKAQLMPQTKWRAAGYIVHHIM